MRVLLISTYELGHQPLHVASPAAKLRRAGHDVSALDLAVEDWAPGRVDQVDAVAVSVPMHTAMRLAVETGRRVKERRPEMPVALYGLYAHVGSERVLGRAADRLICGEYEDALVEWVDGLGSSIAPSQAVTVDIGRRLFQPPLRSVLPPLDRYAHLARGSGHQLVGYVEASHGCRHRCAHCPIPAVYDGRYRVTGLDTVVADVDQLVEAGAGHVTFGDPDFLNAPAYSLDVLETVHRRHPRLSFDITVKVEHILAQRARWGRLADANVAFVVSAVESLDDGILSRLDKGHSAADAEEAVDIIRSSGIDFHPTWLPFTPWTTADGVADIAEFIWRHDLAPVTDPVQLSIRLLVPDGSLVLGVEGIDDHLTGYDADALGHTWSAADPAMDELQVELGGIAEAGASDDADQIETLRSMTRVISRAASRPVPDMSVPDHALGRPRLSEPWFCCAEPTDIQLGVFG